MREIVIPKRFVYNNFFKRLGSRENGFSGFKKLEYIKTLELRLFDTIWETGILWYNEANYGDWFGSLGGRGTKTIARGGKSRERGEE